MPRLYSINLDYYLFFILIEEIKISDMGFSYNTMYCTPLVHTKCMINISYGYSTYAVVIIVDIRRKFTNDKIQWVLGVGSIQITGRMVGWIPI